MPSWISRSAVITTLYYFKTGTQRLASRAGLMINHHHEAGIDLFFFGLVQQPSHAGSVLAVLLCRSESDSNSASCTSIPLID